MLIRDRVIRRSRWRIFQDSRLGDRFHYQQFANFARALFNPFPELIIEQRITEFTGDLADRLLVRGLQRQGFCLEV